MELHRLFEAVTELQAFSIHGIMEAANKALQCQVRHGCTGSIFVTFDSAGNVTGFGFDEFHSEVEFEHAFTINHQLTAHPELSDRTEHMYFLQAYSGPWAQHSQGLIIEQQCRLLSLDPPCYFDSTSGEYLSALDAPMTAPN